MTGALPAAGAIDAAAQAAAVDELRTATDLVRWGASRLAEHGVALGHGQDDPVDEALLLVLHVLHLPFGTPDALLAARLTRAERAAAVALLARRVAERVPAAYLSGEAWFAGLQLRADARALVPRSPFAELIEGRFEAWLDAERVTRIADLGTGGGCIAIACAHAFEAARVDAVDLSEAALQLAAENVALHGLQDRVRLVHADLFAGLQQGGYDLVISNPPYVPRAELDAAPAEFHHEPRDALVAGEDGLDVVRRIVAGAAQHLAPGGILAVEVGSNWPAAAAAFADLALEWPALERGGEGIFIIRREALPGA